ncbi:MAG: HNH endonuclease [Devosia sp.]
MGFAVFVHRADSIYDDRPDQRYQFPKQYLTRVRAAIGDWAIYYEPKKVSLTRGYFAAAKIADVIEDPGTPGMFLALIAPGSYLPFAREIPFNLPSGVAESGLLNDAGRLSGRAQAAVRPLSPADFNRIVELGLVDSDSILPREGSSADVASGSGFSADQVPFELENQRQRTTLLMSRPVRDRVFRTVVLRAYDQTCAVTGFKFINGGGRAEVAGAHIRPVEADGPDIVQNGVALSGTAHWMFDRGLITFTDDLDIVVSRQVNDRDGVQALINPTGRLIAPINTDLRPHSTFLAWHRDNCFKV